MPFGVLASLTLAIGLSGDCGPTASHDQRQACQIALVAMSDTVINDVYAQLRKRLGPAAQSQLREEQRAWIRGRDAACGLPPALDDRNAWLGRMGSDEGNAACVVRLTDERVVELRARLARLAGGPPASHASSSSSADVSARRAPNGALRAHTSRKEGKWYFETTLDVDHLAKLGDWSILVAMLSEDAIGGALETIHRSDRGRPAHNIGFAVDLDGGKIYTRLDGAWQGGAPGGSGGAELKLGRDYLAVVASPSELGPAVRAGAVKLNLGDRAFVFAMPDGYSPLDPFGYTDEPYH